MTIIEQAAAGYRAAVEAIEAVTDLEDGGTCNFDQPVIDLTGIRGNMRKGLKELPFIGDKMGFGFFKGCHWLKLPLKGQANLRSRTAEAARKALEDQGLPIRMYYAMD